MSSAKFQVVIVPIHRKSNLKLESDIAQCRLQKQEIASAYAKASS